MDDSGFASLHISPRAPFQPLLLSDYSPIMQSLPPTIHGPLSQAGFVSTKHSQAVDNLISSDVKVIVVSGPAGSGKSFLAKETCAKLWNGSFKDEEKIYRFLNCESMETLFNDLALFYGDLNYQQVTLSRKKTWQIIQTLYEDMDGQFPNHHKVFVLDDVEQIEEVLKVLNHICGKDAALWKFVVTTQKAVPRPEVFKVLYSGSNFIRLDGFSKEEAATLFQYSDVDEATLQKLLDVLGPLPLALAICMRSLGSDEMECDRAEFVDKYLEQIEMETKTLSKHLKHHDPSASVLIAIKISIDRLINDLPFPAESKEVIKLVSLLNDKNFSNELLLACAETVVSDPNEARLLVQKLMSRMVERCICEKKSENNIRLFSLHKLVKQSMQLFLEDDEKPKLIRNTLVALTRVIPKDGRKHQSRLNGFYAEHGESLNLELQHLAPNINCEAAPVICFLHCKLLVGMGYCQASQNCNLQIGLGKLEQARDRYCELVLGIKYQRLLSQRTVPSSEAHVEIAKKLYAAGQNHHMITLPEYKAYVRTLTKCHRLTKKDLKNMGINVSEKDLVNGHLTDQQLQIFCNEGKSEGQCRIIPPEKLAKVALAELLAEIFAVCSRIYKEKGKETAAKEHAEASVAVYKEVYEGHKIYLLAAVITERNMLILKERLATCAIDIEHISIELEKLSQVGQLPDKRLAFEDGLMRSDMSQDHYHELLCLESKLECQGRLYEFGDEAGRARIYEAGMGLILRRVEELAGKQVFKYSALSHSYRHFGRFLSHCKRPGEAVRFIIKAMGQLHEYKVTEESKTSSGAVGNGSHFPEFETTRFDKLYADLKIYHAAFGDVRRGDEKILMADTDEAKYLRRAMEFWSRTSGENNSNSSNDSNSKYEILDLIAETEIQKEIVTVGEQAV